MGRLAPMEANAFHITAKVFAARLTFMVFPTPHLPHSAQARFVEVVDLV